MNITLRKANTLQKSILDTCNSFDIKTSIELNEFQDVVTELQKANQELFANDARRQKLLLSLYNIRGLVGAANVQSGIDSKLATAAFLDKRIDQLTDLTKSKTVTDLNVLQGRIDKIKNASDERSIYRSDTVSTGVIGEDQMNQIKAEIKNLKKQKQKINDEVLELNIKTEIPLSDEVVITLQSEGLL